MEVAVSYSKEELARVELRKFVEEGLQDVYANQVQEFNTVFDELEERYSADD